MVTQACVREVRRAQNPAREKMKKIIFVSCIAGAREFCQRNVR